MDWLTADRYLSAMESETALLAAAVTGRDPGERVPTCPEWTMRDLVSHVGTGHRLSAGVIEREATAPPAYELVAAPEAAAEWPGWLTAGAAGLIAAVREHGFGAHVWTWVPRYPTAGFWVRRMLHDLIIHRFDATSARVPAVHVGGELDDDLAVDGVAAVHVGGDLDDDLAVDGVADILLCFATISGRGPGSPMAGLRGAGETLRFGAGDRSWHVTLTPDGVTWRDGAGPADVVYQAASALDLLLVLNRRREPGPSAGDRELLGRWLENSKF
ncbi:maleylpyruvate isomerase N-terminal domain-containing protein [Actinoplanes oblitus]|uniref:Maleylpyruvate isomerase N-terminal domain-containing protein n=1 Tax=Actinoplanes oblitus TaxID=3040509 RepID=A0ABY8WRJ4_9ACTN|nr:maleylpyruvate isomerase N-terminal domain-containing protein [Actinoplanes oblitus]WIN00480.1 maleylpyruvate isomerase N-terminal domain-containing protein [Actinoplanes oblitus]